MTAVTASPTVQTGAEGGESTSFSSIPGVAPLDPLTIERLTTYRNDLLHWNQRFNLTAMTEPEAVDRRLIGDALRLLPAIDELTERVTAAGLPTRLIDIGTGAGFPGMVIKIARPHLDVTLLDATRKKVSFLHSVIETLGLNGVVAMHGRAEELGHQRKYRHQFGLVTARAVASLSALLELGLPLLKVGGFGVFPKGEAIEEELAEGERANRTLGGRIISANQLESVQDAPVTRLVIIAKIHETPTRFPRRSGIPATEPLGRIRQ